MRITRSQLKRIIDEEVRRGPTPARRLHEDLGMTSQSLFDEWNGLFDEISNAKPPEVEGDGGDPESEEKSKMQNSSWRGTKNMKFWEALFWIIDSSGNPVIGKGGPEFTVEEAKEMGVELPKGQEKGKIGKRYVAEVDKMGPVMSKWDKIYGGAMLYQHTINKALAYAGYKQLDAYKKPFNYIAEQVSQQQASEVLEALGDTHSKEKADEWIASFEPAMKKIVDNILSDEKFDNDVVKSWESLYGKKDKDKLNKAVGEARAFREKTIQELSKLIESHSHLRHGEIIVERWQRLAGILKG